MANIHNPLRHRMFDVASTCIKVLYYYKDDDGTFWQGLALPRQDNRKLSTFALFADKRFHIICSSCASKDVRDVDTNTGSSNAWCLYWMKTHTNKDSDKGTNERIICTIFT